MKRFVIERDIPGVGSLSCEQLSALSATSNRAVTALAGKVQWVHSCVAADRTFCIYLAVSEELIYLAVSEELVRKHSALAGFPITRITEAPIILDPMTAFS